MMWWLLLLTCDRGFRGALLLRHMDPFRKRLVHVIIARSRPGNPSSRDGSREGDVVGQVEWTGWIGHLDFFFLARTTTGADEGLAGGVTEWIDRNRRFPVFPFARRPPSLHSWGSLPQHNDRYRETGPGVGCRRLWR